MVVDPAPRPVQHEPRYSVDAGPRRHAPPPRPPRHAEPRYVEEPGHRVRVVNQGPNYSNLAPAPSYMVNQGPTVSGLATGPAYLVNQGPTYTGAAVTAVPPVYEVDGVAVSYPHLRADPAWKVCQIDRRTNAYSYCIPYSYHPYGAPGYRPFGTYNAHRGGGVVYAAPSARIIHVED
jgi:hypothetical protein